MTPDDINKWIARRWLGIVVVAYMLGFMSALLIVLVVLLLHASM